MRFDLQASTSVSPTSPNGSHFSRTSSGLQLRQMKFLNIFDIGARRSKASASDGKKTFNEGQGNMEEGDA